MFSIFNSTAPWDEDYESNSSQSYRSELMRNSNESFISNGESTTNSLNSTNRSNRSTPSTRSPPSTRSIRSIISSGTSTTQEFMPDNGDMSSDAWQDSLNAFEGTSVASTPRIVSAQRNRQQTDAAQPIVDLVDLSNLEANRQSRIRAARLVEPTSVIDLCTPPRVTGFINLAEYGDRAVPVARRRRRQTVQLIELTDNLDAAAADAVAGAGADGASPTKRSCNSLNITSEDLYKCPVCLDTARHNEPYTTRCGHVFCKVCIEGAVRSTHKCPLCNKKITMRQLLRIYI